VAELERISLTLGRRRRRAIRITFVPLVDCFIILLIFFMLQSSFTVPHGMDLRSEKKEQLKAGSTSSESSLIYIELHKDGGLWLDGERRDFADLPGALPKKTDKSVIVASDPGVPLQRAVDVIDVLNAHGLTRVSLREARQFR
jgi:biopolymer transport protein ExbD